MGEVEGEGCRNGGSGAGGGGLPEWGGTSHDLALCIMPHFFCSLHVHHTAKIKVKLLGGGGTCTACRPVYVPYPGFTPVYHTPVYHTPVYHTPVSYAPVCYAHAIAERHQMHVIRIFRLCTNSPTAIAISMLCR